MDSPILIWVSVGIVISLILAFVLGMMIYLTITTISFCIQCTASHPPYSPVPGPVLVPTLVQDLNNNCPSINYNQLHST